MSVCVCMSVCACACVCVRVCAFVEVGLGCFFSHSQKALNNTPDVDFLSVGCAVALFGCLPLVPKAVCRVM